MLAARYTKLLRNPHRNSLKLDNRTLFWDFQKRQVVYPMVLYCFYPEYTSYYLYLHSDSVHDLNG